MPTITCEWGAEGVRLGRATADVLIIVDVLSFSTTVDVATARGATVLPYRHRDATAADFARQHDAELAGPRQANGSGWSLSPASMQSVPPDTRIVVPSPNGSTLCLAAGDAVTLLGCLRNARAVATAAAALGDRIALVPAGERWPHDHTLRPALEDWLGVGAIAHHLLADPSGRNRWVASPEPLAAVAAFRAATATAETHDGDRGDNDGGDANGNGDPLHAWVAACPSGVELIERGFADDVRVATRLDVSECVPRLVDGEIRAGA